jgi:uncharacterized protein YgiM (DUF1202 family)
MKHSLFRTLAVTALLSCSLSLSALAVEGAGTVNATAVNLREAAGTGSAIITTVAKNTPVVVVDRQDKNWYKVLTAGHEGYMSAAYIDYAEKLEAAFGKGVIAGNTVALAAGPSTAAATLGYL